MRTEFDHGGSAAIRLSTDGDAAQVRRDAASLARANLAALMIEEQVGLPRAEESPKAEYERASYAAAAADPQQAEGATTRWVELLEYLGLASSPPREVGTCARPGCGKDLSLTGAASSTGGGLTFTARKKGFCSQRCMKLANQRNGGVVE